MKSPKIRLHWGLIGISEAIPFISIALFAGYVADIVNRKLLIVAANFIYLLCAFTLFLFVFKFNYLFHSGHAFPLYAVIFITGIARGFIYPAQAAIMAQLVPRELYANSTTWNSTFWHIATVSGPGNWRTYLRFCRNYLCLCHRCFFLFLSALSCLL